MPKDDEFTSVADAMKTWDENLPPNHSGRTLLAALHALENNELAFLSIEGPEDAESVIWLSLLSLGTVENGTLKYIIYPAAETGEDLRNRDTLIAAIVSRPEPIALHKEALANAPPPCTTITFAYYGVDQDGVNVVGIAWHPDVSFESAVGQLKLAVTYVRERESEAATGGS